METIGAQVLEILMKRRLILGAFLFAGVPASTALWVLRLPARQEKPRSLHLPMRDAVAELPYSGASLTPIMDELGEEAEAAEGTQASVRPAARREAPATVAQRLARVMEARRTEGVEEKAERTGGGLAAPMARGRLNPLQGLGSGAGGGAQTSASFAIARAPRMAGAGPLGSVGLVTAGASKRFNPARLLRAGGVSGIMNGLRQATRLLSGGPSNPAFAGATGSFGGAPGFSGAEVPGGLASVGSPEGGIGNMGGGPEGQDNSTFNPPVDPTVPLAPPPVVPQDVAADGLPEIPAANLAARCEAFTQAAEDSSGLLERLRLAAGDAAASLRATVVVDRAHAYNWDTQEKTLLSEQLAPLSGVRCMSPDGKTDHCRTLRKFLMVRASNVDAIREQVSGDINSLNLAFSGLAGAPPASVTGFLGATGGINLEVGLQPMVQDPSALEGLWDNALSSIPEPYCYPPYGCVDFTEVKNRVRKAASRDRSVQKLVKDDVSKSWCEKNNCKAPTDLSGLAEALGKHNDALQVWAAEAPAGPLNQTAESLSHLKSAQGLLASPTGNFSRNVVDGTKELKLAYDALSRATGSFSASRDEACRAEP